MGCRSASTNGFKITTLARFVGTALCATEHNLSVERVAGENGNLLLPLHDRSSNFLTAALTADVWIAGSVVQSAWAFQ